MSLDFENIYDGTNNNVQENDQISGEIKNMFNENQEKKILSETTNIINNINADCVNPFYKEIPKKLESNEPVKEIQQLEDNGQIEKISQKLATKDFKEISKELEDETKNKNLIPLIQDNKKEFENNNSQNNENEIINKTESVEKVEDDITPGPSTSYNLVEKQLRRRTVNKPYYKSLKDFPILKNKPKSLGSLRLGCRNRVILYNLFTQLSSTPLVKLKRIDEYLNK